ncbi:MAG TPA: dihydroneopterin aldolase [Actinomycetota bacterium]
MTTIRISGLRCRGRLGVTEEERERPQEIVVDLEIEVEAADDALDATADYDGVLRVVRGLVATESFVLLETLARRIAQIVASQPGASSCRATVHKPGAARALKVDDVAASAVAGRGG